MTTDELAAILHRHPGLDVVIVTKDTIEPVWGWDLDCFEEKDGTVLVLIADEDD